MTTRTRTPKPRLPASSEQEQERGALEVILALDVSSTATGFAFFVDGKLGVFGRIGPVGKEGSVERIDTMVGALGVIIDSRLPATVVMEWSSGKIHARLKRKRAKEGKSEAIPGLAVMGQAQGAVRQMLLERSYEPILIPESWTGRVSKPDRAAIVACEHPEYRRLYNARQDPGYDAADAIGLGHWYLAKRRLESLIGGRS